MKSLYLLCSILTITRATHFVSFAPAPLNHDGTVADTPEVAAAKVAHYAELAKAGGAVPRYHTTHWLLPVAPLNHDGTVADTPAVIAAKAAHFAEHAKVLGYPVYTYAPQYYTPKWYGPKAPLNPDGTVAETSEVKHAKTEHLAAHARARSHFSPIGIHIADTPEVNAARAEHLSAYHKVLSRVARSPIYLNADGTVADTPEVAAAKASHFAEIAKARGISYIPVYTGHWTGPQAPLNHDGTVAETPEVKAAKAVHLAAHSRALHGVKVFQPVTDFYSGGYSNAKNYFVPAPLNPDGTVAETPEVYNRKLEHLDAHRKELERLSYFSH